MGYRAVTTATLAIVAAALAGTPCLAQDSTLQASQPTPGTLCADLEPGTMVRVRFFTGDDRVPGADGNEARLEVGKLESCKDGMLVIRPEHGSGELLWIPLDTVENVQVRRRENGDAMAGAALGLVVGIVASFAAQTNHHQDEFLGGLEDMGDNIKRGVGITFGTTLLGALIGSATGGERWEDVEFGGRTALTVSGSGGGLALAVACSF